uniref:fimbrillin family protein n=1 Tax=Prevotella sp. TaxID=59823 RepID=UPI0040293C61
MNNHIIRCVALALVVLTLAACGDDLEPTQPQGPKSTPMTFVVDYPGQTRATATDFELGDRIGLYVADAKEPLELAGNLVNNEALTFDGNKWEAGRTLYWDEGTYNAYAYYPYMQDVTSVTDQPFSVSTDQSTQKTATALGGYEASDLLFATTKDVKASDSPVRLTFKHIMSKLKIRLIKGEDFEGDMPTTAKVYIHNTVPTATIDLQAGVATRYVKGTRQTIVAHQDGDTSYSAIIVPQRIDNRQPLVEVEMMGVSYLFESKFLFKPGTEHLVNLVISENPDKVKINIGGEKQNW